PPQSLSYTAQADGAIVAVAEPDLTAAAVYLEPPSQDSVEARVHRLQIQVSLDEGGDLIERVAGISRTQSEFRYRWVAGPAAIGRGSPRPGEIRVESPGSSGAAELNPSDRQTEAGLATDSDGIPDRVA